LLIPIVVRLPRVTRSATRLADPVVDDRGANPGCINSSSVVARIEELDLAMAPNARAAAKQALTARDIAGMDDHVRPPTPLAPEALRVVVDELINEPENISCFGRF
jgi:hypothetical protein